MRIAETGLRRRLDRIVLDIIYIALTLALFALVSLIARAVDRA
ncbi:hypothetical protein [Microbacterium aurugineum]